MLVLMYKIDSTHPMKQSETSNFNSPSHQNETAREMRCSTESLDTVKQRPMNRIISDSCSWLVMRTENV